MYCKTSSVYSVGSRTQGRGREGGKEGRREEEEKEEERDIIIRYNYNYVMLFLGIYTFYRKHTRSRNSQKCAII